MLKRWLFSSVWAPDGGTGAGAGTPPAAGAGAAAPPPAATNEAPAGATGATGAAAGGTPAAAPAVAFADSLPADLKEMAVFKDIKDLDGLARSYANAAKMVGLDKGRIVALPAEGDEAGWKDLFGKLGRPADAKEYGFKAPEGVPIDPMLQESFASTAHELGLSTKQATKLYEWWNGQAAAARTAGEQSTAQAQAAATATLKTEWGAAFDQNLALAQKAVEHYSTPEVKAELDKSGLGNNPALVKLFAKLGSQLSEDGLIGKGGGGTETISSPTEARQQINALRADTEFSKAYLNKAHPGHADAVEKMRLLHEQAYPPPAAA